MITVNTSAESRNLTTLENVLEALSSAPTAIEQSVLLETLIARASAAVERICGRVFAREDVTETIAGSGRVELLLERTPVISLTSVERAGETVSDVQISDREAGLLFVQTGFQRSGIAFPGGIQPWPSGSAKLDWEVQYLGGYYLPSFTAAVSGAPGATDVLLPGDLEGIVINVVASWFTEAVGERRAPGVSSERLGDWSANYGWVEGATRLPDRVRAELERNWKRV